MLAKSATPATPRVNTLRAAVTENVRSNISMERRLRLAWSMTLAEGNPNVSLSSRLNSGTLSSAILTPNLTRETSG